MKRSGIKKGRNNLKHLIMCKLGIRNRFNQILDNELIRINYLFVKNNFLSGFPSFGFQLKEISTCR